MTQPIDTEPTGDSKPTFTIRWGETRYATEGAKYMHLIVRNEMLPLFQELQSKPSSVEDAFLFDSIAWVLEYPNYWDTFIKETQLGHFEGNEWHGKSTSEALQALIDEVKKESDPAVEERTAFVKEIEQFIDTRDTTRIQLIIAKDTEKGDLEDGAYWIYVSHPPATFPDGKPARQREFSTLNQGCQTLNIAVLFNEGLIPKRFQGLLKPNAKLESMKVGDKHFQIKTLKLDNLSDDELKARIDRFSQRRTLLDKAIQKILATRDKYLHRHGVHVDALKTITDRNYAKTYALATHRGIEGVVQNHRIVLPPEPIE